MELTGHHILITGGTTGIGLALAQALLAQGNTVLAVDYSPENIKAAQAKSPQLQTHLTDLSSAAQRVALKDWIQTDFKDIDILINNAGIQRWINLLNLKHDWDWYHQELAINFEAQLHLTMLLLPMITQQPKGAIINVSSGLVTNPGAWVPLYTAAKTGVHGFTQALRLQLQDTPTKVFEILPPAVNTDLGGSGAHTYGVDLSEFIAAVLDQLTQDLPEITYGTSWDQLRATKAHNLATTQQTWELFKDNPNFKNA